ncbi:MAG: phospho-sugar nucleotidyltransferase protein [Betaproteobacteria bacterium]|nr:phospho-sugar nucleotidyltransferase protein [Betaproteobacteria bacterium]
MTTAIVLAGGLGTRLRSEVADLPKPMAPIAGRPFLEHQLNYWIAQGVRRFVLSIGYLPQTIVDHFGAAYKGAALEYVIEKTPMGTGGGLLLAVEQSGIDEPFLALNGDTYFAADLSVLKDFAAAHDADWCFSLFRTSEPGRYMGMEVSGHGMITALQTDTAQRDRFANGGVYWIEPRMLKERYGLTGKISLEDDFLPAALRAGKRLCGVEFPGTFIDIGVPADYRRAQTLLAGTGQQSTI